MKRGVAIRSLYRGNVREDRVTSGYVSGMSARGAQFRTLMGPFQRVVIIDRRQAFISDYVSGTVAAAWHIRDRAVVAFAAEVWEETWRRSEVWHGEQITPAGPVASTTRLQREILRDAAVAMEQRVTAQRLGISVRKVNGELGKLKDKWGAASLAELTYKWALSPDRLVNDGPGEVEAAA